MRMPFALATLALIMATSSAAAQPLGVFRWQLQPYCNVVTLAVTQNGALFTLDGTDNQCVAGPAASVLGTAFFNPDGSVGMGLHLVVAPGATPVHVTATLNPTTLGGTWADSAGHSGALVLGPPSPASGPPRPGGGLAGVAVTTIAAGPGLTGSGESGAVSLAVAFGGTGAAATAARSDHTHAVGAAGAANTGVGVNALASSTGGGNTAIGWRSLSSNTTGTSNTAGGMEALERNTSGAANTAFGRSSLFSNETGDSNTAVGYLSLNSNVTGNLNTAVGSFALLRNTTGPGNTALGFRTLTANTVGDVNTAVGSSSLASNTIGNGNTAVGNSSLGNNTTGGRNVAIGHNAGFNVTTGSNNIHIANNGFATENNTIRIGRTDTAMFSFPHTRAFVAGVRGVTTGNNNAVAVLIDSSGQLGTVSSTRRAKEAIVDLGEPGFAVQRLRPVQFQYRQPFADGTKPVQYGLIAEEVAEVLPELVAHDDAGEPATVKYHVLPTLLVAEVQRLERERQSLEATVLALERRLAAVERLLTATEKR
jgi:hypothetical protein